MLRWWMVGVMLVAGCEVEGRTCGHGLTQVHYTSKALMAGVFVHRVESVETVAGDYALPAPSDEWITVEARFDEDFWFAERDDALIVLRLNGHASLIDGPCGPIRDVSEPWFARPFVRLDPTTEIGASIELVDSTLAHVEPTAMQWDSFEEFVQPLAFDEDHLGFTLRADYYIEPAGCDDPSCSSTVRLTHHFRRP